MPPDREAAPQRIQLALKLLIAAFVIAALGFPINQLAAYAMLIIAVVILAVGRVTASRRAWLIAIVIMFAAIAAKQIVGPPRIEEGHNVFLPGGADSALIKGLPADVYGFMAKEFSATYPAERRCNPAVMGCWREEESPKRVYAFSFDGLYDRPAYSRRVTGIDFSDPIWQRLGFVNEGYNWYSGVSDIQRGPRVRSLASFVQPFLITMPRFVMFSFPAAYAGGELCWRGTVLWESAGGRFETLQHAEKSCRQITTSDIGKRIYGVAIKNDPPLAMDLRLGLALKLRQILEPALGLLGTALILMCLVRWESRKLRLPFTLIGLGLVIAILHDISFVGGVRPFDGGDDGIIYDAWSRGIVQQLLGGHIAAALQGGENVFYFTPGMRYLRAVEHLIFGETYLGALSLVLLMPFLVFAIFRRFFSDRTALAMALIFIAIPVGALFGSTFFLYVKWASRGFGDPAAMAFFLSGLILLIGRTAAGPDRRFGSAFAAGVLFALALFIRPNLALGVAVLLGGAGLATLWQRQIYRLAGLCIGFSAVFCMALHNWYYGGVFVLFSGQTTLVEARPMPPETWLAAFSELLRFDFSGGYLSRGFIQIARMLSGPSESYLMSPLHAVAIAIVIWVALSRRYDGWLRLTAGSALGLHAPAVIYLYSSRYHLLAWLLTLLVCTAWVRDQAMPWLRQRYPALVQSLQQRSLSKWLTHVLDWWMRATGLVPRPA